MKLYEITHEHQKALTEMTEAGFTQEEISDNLAGIAGEFEDKAISCIMYEKTLQGQIDTLAGEIKRLSAMKKSIDNKVLGFREYIRSNMEATGINKIEHALFNITLRKASQVVQVDDEKQVPSDYKILQPPKIDRVAIKKALQSGSVDGCSLVDVKRGLLIK